MKKLYGKSCIVLCLSMLLTVFSGCTEQEEVPVLLDPIVGQTVFRPVERGDLGKLSVYMGQIVPRQYCHFFSKNVTLSEITCELGSYVEEGQLLAYIDEEDTKKKLAAKQTELAFYKRKQELRMDIHKNQLDYLELMKVYIGYNKEGQKENQKQIDLEQENTSYDSQLAEYMIQSMEREIGELRELLEKGRLYAKHSGYVSYVCDLSSGKGISAYENVVVVADYEDRHIEAMDVIANVNSTRFYTQMYAYIDGKREELEVVPYSERELLYMKNTGKNVPIWFTTTSGNMAELGETVVLNFIKDGREDVLYVGQDSVKSDDGGIYVLVKEKDESIQKRYIEPGIGDGFYIEVLSGLEEGELVQNDLSETVITDYKPFVVSRSDYVEEVNSVSVKQTELSNDFYIPPCSGTIEEVFVAIGDTVEKGDPLYTIANTDGRGIIADLEKQLQQLDLSFAQSIERADKNLWDLNQVKGQISYLITKAEDERELICVEYEENKQLLETRLAEAKKTYNQGSTTTIYAKNGGMVRAMKLRKGTKVTPSVGSLLQIAILSSDKIWVYAPEMTPGAKKKVEVKAGKPVTLLGKGVTYQGISVDGWSSGDLFYFTENDRVYCTQNRIRKANGIMITVQVKGENLYADKSQSLKGVFEAVHLSKQIIIPGAAVFEEPTLIGQMEYVWKIVDGTLVKQYIQRGYEYGIGTKKDVIVLSGLEEGDVLACPADTTF